MSIYLNKDSKIIVQGITGGMGAKHTALMLDSGATIVGGVNAAQGRHHGDPQGRHDGADVELPVFGTVAEAMKETGADVSVLFVPPAFTKDAAIEAIDAEMPLIVVITEGVPVQDTAEVWSYLQGKSTRMIGPNCPGIITPGESLAGITPHTIAGKGPVGLVSKSGTLTYQMMYELRDFGFSTAIGIGGDPIVGTTHIDALQAFEDDPETKVIVMIGEIGGDAEERAAALHQGQHHQAGRRLRRGLHRPRRARPWATPAPSCPAPPAPRPPSRRPSRPSASRSARRRPRPLPSRARSCSRSDGSRDGRLRDLLDHRTTRGPPPPQVAGLGRPGPRWLSGGSQPVGGASAASG